MGPSGQNQLYHTPFLFKILDLTENKKIVNDPFKVKVLFWKSQTSKNIERSAA